MGLLSWLTGKKTQDAGAERGPAREPPAEDAAKAHGTAEAAAAAPGAGATSEEAAADAAYLAQLEAAIDSRVGALRVDASRGLLERWSEGDPAAAQAMASRVETLLSDPEPQVRQAALAAVRMMRKPENLEKHSSAVLALLADSAGSVRTAAVRAAIRLPGEVARTQVRALLQSREEPQRFDAASALAEVQDVAALPVLLASLEEDIRRQEALSAIMALGDPAALPVLRKLWDSEEAEGLGEFDRTLLAAAMARFGDEKGRAHLVDRVASSGDDRPVAVEWAGRLGVAEAVPALEELAGQEGEAARGAALQALGRLKASGAEARLIEVLEDAEMADDLRMDAAEGLAELGTAEALKRLEAHAAEATELGQVCRELLAEVAALAAAPGSSAAAPGSLATAPGSAGQGER